MSDDRDVAVSITVDTSVVEAGVGQVSASLAELDSSVQELQARMQAASAGVQSSLASMAAPASAFGAATEAGAARAEVALTRVAHSSQAVNRELIVLAHEAATGRWTRLGGSLMVLAGRMDLLSKIASPMGIAIGGVTLSLAALGLAAMKGAAEVRAFEGAMIATGGYADLTASSFRDMADHIANDTHSGTGKAIASLTGLINSGKFTGNALRLVAEDAVLMGRATGENTDKMSAYFEKGADDVTKFAADYEEKYHQITLAQFEHIQKLDEEAQHAQAAEELFKDIHDYLAGEGVAKLNQYNSAWSLITNTINAAVEAAKGFGRAPTPSEHIGELQGMIADRQAGRMANVPGGATVAELQAQLRQWELIRNMHEFVADATAREATAQTAGVAASKQWGDSLRRAKDDGSALSARMAEIKTQYDALIAAHPENKGLYDQQRSVLEANAERTLKPPEAPKTPKPKGMEDAFGLDQETIQSQVEGLQDYSAEAAAKLEAEFWQKKLEGLKQGTTEYHQVFEAFTRAQHQLERQQYQDRLEADREGIAKADEAGSLQEHGKAWETYFADLGRHYRSDSAEYIKAVAEKERADAAFHRKAAQQAVAKDQEGVDARVGDLGDAGKAKDSTFDTQRSAVQARTQSGVTSARLAAQELAALDKEQEASDIATQKAILAEKEQGFAKEVADANGVQAVLDDIAKRRLAAETQSAKQIADIQAQFAKKSADDQIREVERIQQQWSQRVNSITQTVGQGFLQMARGSETFGQFGIHVAESVENAFVSAVEKQVSSWIMNMGIAAGLIPSQMAATNLPQVEGAAAVAAANAIASTEAIPVIGPEIAPAAGNAAYLAVMAYAPMASAAGGYDIPGGLNPLVQAHAREMILPASIADPLRRQLGHGGMFGAQGGAGGGNGGDFHQHLNVQAIDARGVEGWARSNAGKGAMRSIGRRL